MWQIDLSFCLPVSIRQSFCSSHQPLTRLNSWILRSQGVYHRGSWGMRPERIMSRASAILLAAIAAAPAPTFAQDTDFGRAEFMVSCAQCHGISGKGDGVLASYLTTEVADLTTIQRKNGGVFPFAEIYATIEGGGRAGPHGTREMPAWGNRYSVEAAEAYGFQYTPSEQIAYIHARILALIEYIARIQIE